ncbi:hypothetical protein F4810DRAFT_402213 [Camillea tinctor]|nr:hypothetical protein F4810DRAFT_402213 [Camillea tinctor]
MNDIYSLLSIVYYCVGVLYIFFGGYAVRRLYYFPQIFFEIFISSHIRCFYYFLLYSTLYPLEQAWWFGAVLYASCHEAGTYLLFCAFYLLLPPGGKGKRGRESGLVGLVGGGEESNAGKS